MNVEIMTIAVILITIVDSCAALLELIDRLYLSRDIDTGALSYHLVTIYLLVVRFKQHIYTNI